MEPPTLDPTGSNEPDDVIVFHPPAGWMPNATAARRLLDVTLAVQRRRQAEQRAA